MKHNSPSLEFVPPPKPKTEQHTTPHLCSALSDDGLEKKSRYLFNHDPDSAHNTTDNLRRTRSEVENPHTSHIFGQPYEDIKQKYILGKEIGRGQYGVIRICVDRRTRESFACKIICKSSLKTPLEVEDVKLEVRVMGVLKGHPAVIELKEVIEDANKLYIVMELCKGGELFDKISEKKRYTEPEAALVCHTLLSAIKLFASKGIVHRDLKPENILLRSSASDTCIKIIDYGLACFIHPGMKLHSLSGSAYYIAPEVLDGSYGIEVDMWSMGVIMYILLRGIPPFWAEEDEDIFKAIKTGKYDISNGSWKSISSEAKDLIKRMLMQDPKQRITPKEALLHPWILNHCKDVQATAEKKEAVVVAETVMSDHDIAIARPVSVAPFQRSLCIPPSRLSMLRSRTGSGVFVRPVSIASSSSSSASPSPQPAVKLSKPQTVPAGSKSETVLLSRHSCDGAHITKLYKFHNEEGNGSAHGSPHYHTGQLMMKKMNLTISPTFVDSSSSPLCHGEGSGDYSPLTRTPNRVNFGDYSPMMHTPDRLNSGDLAFLSESMSSLKLR